ncbi:hypothetical protein [Leptonema illini]|uniref:Uncharacterized protein n=1 Tax=Leptonema illini DSM 21528 TaxID=929563 RepID=H2CFD5_9LEPT|nr:hypothetical protein [Leptonema illini]EHQ07760.1 hypothetical protein Lepil_3097 [Leptonema illini DSM 21528]
MGEKEGKVGKVRRKGEEMRKYFAVIFALAVLGALLSLLLFVPSPISGGPLAERMLIELGIHPFERALILVGSLFALFFSTSIMFYAWIDILCQDSNISRIQIFMMCFLPVINTYTAPAMIHSHWPTDPGRALNILLWSSRLSAMVGYWGSIIANTIEGYFYPLGSAGHAVSSILSLLVILFFFAQPVLVWLSSKQTPKEEVD